MTLFGPEGLPAREAGSKTQPAQPVVEMRAPVRVGLTVAYDGTGFHGFAAQPGQITVGGALAEAIEKVVGHEVGLTCAGRTDAGVHAWGQVVHADLAPARGTLDLDALARSCNAMLAPAVVVREAAVAPAGFD
ncbi:MAG TPA: hypothetical protein VG476_17535, partial [Acidimicrobiales bacterium]|nr:hypothetical protein [Acidimicrobiales bacterium]